MKKVLLIKEVITKYRISVYSELFNELSTQSIELKILSNAQEEEDKKKIFDIEQYDWSQKKHLVRIWKFKFYLLSLREILDPDLIIFVNEASWAHNIPYMLLRKCFGKKNALWGHSHNHQREAAFLGEEQITNLLLNLSRKLCDGFFAYTQITADWLINSGFPNSKIFIINNSVSASVITQSVLEGRFKSRQNRALNIVVIGSLYSEKNVDRLTAIMKATSNLNLHFHVIGGGPEEYKINEYIRQFKNCSFYGTLFGERKSTILKKADLVLFPGLVGLGILDAFANATPVIVFSDGRHSPEIAYFKDKYNGLLFQTTEDCLKYLNDVQVADFERLSIAALSTYQDYSPEKMLKRVKESIGFILDGQKL